MKTVITRKNFELFRLDNESAKNFERCCAKELSDFHQESLKWCGNALRQKDSQHFWSDGRYCWYTDGTQEKIECVWMTTNGILMFEDLTNEILYRVSFN